VIAITKCPIPAPTVNEFTPSLRAARKCARTSDYVMETIMSKTNHTSYGAAATSERELTEDDLENRVLADSELDAVSGGIVRSMPNGRTDVIKAMGNTKWGDVEIRPSTLREKIMHKTNTSKCGHGTFEDRPLDDAELNAVTGGLSYEEVKFEYTERTLGGPDTRPARIRAR
jgi:hypothetical protein